jgi:hypothetical protein
MYTRFEDFFYLFRILRAEPRSDSAYVIQWSDPRIRVRIKNVSDLEKWLVKNAMEDFNTNLQCCPDVL